MHYIKHSYHNSYMRQFYIRIYILDNNMLFYLFASMEKYFVFLCWVGRVLVLCRARKQILLSRFI